MSRRLARAAALCWLGVLLATSGACGGAFHGSPQPAALVPAGAVTRHVVVVSIDGLRPDAIPFARARTLERLMQEGAHAAEARTIFPSWTLPSHTSMITGVGVETHGINWNTNLTGIHGVVGVPTMLELARTAGLHTATFLGKRKLLHLLRPGSLDHALYPRTEVYLAADQVVEAAVRYLQFERPNLLFVHLPDPDLAGHLFGWMRFPYRWNVRRADQAVRALWEASQRAFGEDFVLIVTADHGGHGRTHGTAAELDMRIPWIAWGRGVSPGTISAPIQTYDTAATALWLLGVPVPAEWEGRPVRSAFSAADAP
ncbi:MAG TPA: ectonucleotide pyrophosphatase/phosphodiesterase [Longimicrobiaceae bacterium]|nr:ectonucleotide pyrophosphatase/phosphodiesterase [Longimicrobiaceae bacterium]